MPCFGCPHALRPFKHKRPCDHTNGQRAFLTGSFRHNRRSPSARAAAHTGRHKHHIRAMQGFVEHVQRLFRRLGSYFRVTPGTQPSGCAFAYLNLPPGTAANQRLAVCVYRNEVNTDDILFDHPVHRITTATTHAYDANESRSFCRWHSLHWF